MSRKVMIVIGSPRKKGNSATLAKQVAAGSRAAGALVETFCRYVEDDYYEWVKDNVKSFFNHGDPDWDWIKGRINYYSEG